MHRLFSFLLLLSSTLLSAEEWQLKNAYFQTENDADFRDDAAYSYGGKFGALFYRKESQDSFIHIPFSDYKNSDNYLSFSFAHKLYTPKDLNESALIVDDRPYAGYMYLQSALHQVKDNSLISLTTQIGIVGPSSKMESVQKIIHDLIGSPYPNGWSNQIQDELIIQINFSQKEYYKLEDIYGYDAVLMPEYGFELGNASTKAYTTALFRWGKNVPKDFGAFLIDNTSTSKIPLNIKKEDKKKWRYYLNFSLKANAIARNIFLDGNSFKESHSVEKNYLSLDIGYGLSFAYKDFSFDYLRRHATKEFKLQDEYYSYGSFLFSYHY